MLFAKPFDIVRKGASQRPLTSLRGRVLSRAMIIWIVFAVVTACVILAVARPLGRTAAPAPEGASEIQAYKLQLAELAREQERGAIGKDEAEQTRTEISRRLLKASRQSGVTAFSGGSDRKFRANIVFIALAAVIAVGAASVYAIYGTPSMPDEPLQARLNAPAREQPLAIQIANVERRLRTNPRDARGWTVIAPVYFRTGQFYKAADAYRRAIALSGEDEDKLLGVFESLTFAKDGVIPEEAKPALKAALARNPKSLRGRFWLAALAGQDGRKADAEKIYREMLSEDIPSNWKGLIYKQLEALTSEPENPATENAQASSNAPQGDQGAMIRGMVERLAARLKENGADLDGWLKLIRSYAVLNETGKAQEAAASARKQFGSDPQAVEQIDTLTRGLGLAPGEVNTQASSNAPQGDQGAMIRGMVERLAARLKENGTDLDGWLKLIRSYAVLNEPAKAQDAAESARKQFSSEPQAIEQIDTLTRGLGLAPADGKGGQSKS